MAAGVVGAGTSKRDFLAGAGAGAAAADIPKVAEPQSSSAASDAGAATAADDDWGSATFGLSLIHI